MSSSQDGWNSVPQQILGVPLRSSVASNWTLWCMRELCSDPEMQQESPQGVRTETDSKPVCLNWFAKLAFESPLFVPQIVNKDFTSLSAQVATMVSIVQELSRFQLTSQGELGPNQFRSPG